MTKTIIILHGWRLTGSRYAAIQEIFEKKGFTVFAPDLPGSGDIPLQKSVMRVDDYVQFVLDFLQKKKLKKVILIGHSFGGRIAAKLTAQHPELVEKLILTGAPLIKEPLSPKKKLFSLFARIGKSVVPVSVDSKVRKLLYYLLGEWDYYKAPQDIRETFKAVIAEDIAPNLPLITVPTLVLWGGNDTFVTKKIGQQIVQKMTNGTYVEIPEGTHKLPYEQPELFAKEVLEFMNI